MRRLLFSMAAVLAIAGPAYATTPLQRAVVLGRRLGCAFAGALIDGCEKAAGGNFIVPNFSTYARQSGQSWTSSHPWGWNAPAVDYRIGYRVPDGALKDPIANLPKGCEIDTSVLGGPMVGCYNYANPTLRGYDFSKAVYNGTTYYCIPLRFHSSVTGKIRVIDSKFKNGSNCSRKDAVANGYMGDQFAGYITGTTLCVQGSPTLGTIQVGDASATLTDTQGKILSGTYITAAGQGTQACQTGETAYTVSQTQSSGSTSAPLTVQQKSDILTVTAMTSGSIQNNDFVQGGTVINASTTVSGGTGGAGTYTLDRYWFDPGSTYTFGMDQGYLIATDNGSTANVVIDHDFFDADAQNEPMSFNGVAFLNTSGDVEAQYDVFLHSPARPVATDTFGNIINEHNYFENFVYNTDDGHREVWVNAVGTGTVKSYVNRYNVAVLGADMPYVAAGGPALFWLGGGSTGTTYAYVSADHNIGIVNCAGGACTGSNLNISAMFEIQTSTYQAINLTSNFADMTGALFPGAAYSTGSPTCTKATHWSGNTLLTTGGTFSAWSGASGGC